jgi:hypothetical protein
MLSVKQTSNVSKDYLTSYVRSQIFSLSNTLKRIEDFDDYEEDFLKESLKEVERKLAKLRKMV